MVVTRSGYTITDVSLEAAAGTIHLYPQAGAGNVTIAGGNWAGNGTVLAVNGAAPGFTLTSNLTNSSSTDNSYAKMAMVVGGTNEYLVMQATNGVAGAGQGQIITGAGATNGMALTSGAGGISINPKNGSLTLGPALGTATAGNIWVVDGSNLGTGVGGQINLQATNTSSAAVSYAAIKGYGTNGNAGAESGDLQVLTRLTGTLSQWGRFVSNGTLLFQTGQILTPGASGTLTLPAATDTLVGKATTDTLTNKTLTSPTINGGTLAGTTTISGTIAFTGVGSPASISTSQNNWSPTGLGSDKVFRITSSAAVNITGIVAQPAGTEITIINIGTSAITLTNLDAASTAANQFNLGAATPITPNAAITLWYDGTSSVWRPTGGSGGSSVYIQDTAPTGVTSGTLWWQSSTGTLYVYYNDGTSSQWVSASPLVALPAAVQYDAPQTLTATQQDTAQQNIGLASVLRGYLNGLVLSTAGSSATFSVASGVANDSTFADFMTLSSAISKTTSAWAVGTGNGGLDTGSIAASTWYHAYLIKRTDTGVVDVLVSLSASAPTMPASYTLKRRIGSMKTNGSSQWVGFIQNGDEFLWTAPAVDLNAVTLIAAATLYTLTVPTGLKVNALFNGEIIATGNVASSIYTPDIGVQTLATVGVQLWSATSDAAGAPFNVRTNTSAQVYAVSSSASGTLTITTNGWIDTRGKL
jgi:hypothetical protein